MTLRPPQVCLTFIGPIRKVAMPNRVLLYAFDMLQATGSITLSFETPELAIKERDRLTGLPHSHRVPSTRLMKAIQQAMGPSS